MSNNLDSNQDGYVLTTLVWVQKERLSQTTKVTISKVRMKMLLFLQFFTVIDSPSFCHPEQGPNCLQRLSADDKGLQFFMVIDPQMFKKVPAIWPFLSACAKKLQFFMVIDSQMFKKVPAIWPFLSECAKRLQFFIVIDPEMFKKVPAIWPFLSACAKRLQFFMVIDPQMFKKIPSIWPFLSARATSVRLLSSM